MSSPTVPQWQFIELNTHPLLQGELGDVSCVLGSFEHEDDKTVVSAFNDGPGRTVLRFMPSRPGRYRYTVYQGTESTIVGKGEFNCAASDARGPVRIHDIYHFRYQDGSTFFPFGTTCYAFGYADPEDAESVMAGLRQSRFNKVRLNILSKLSPERSILPFASAAITAAQIQPDVAEAEGSGLKLNHVYFRRLDDRLFLLRELGIQADLIFFYPHDPLTGNNIARSLCDQYIQYVVSRYAAFHNVWWSAANEHDLIKTRDTPDWDHILALIQSSDPYAHLRSIHHSRTRFDHTKPLVTHASLQQTDFQNAELYRSTWLKPILWDEIEYEGDIPARWGNLSAQELTHRFWQVMLTGTYATHGETFSLPSGLNAWTISGRLRGESGPRIRFLRELIEALNPSGGLAPIEDCEYLCAHIEQRAFIVYFGVHRPRRFVFPLPEGKQFRVRVIDTFKMTVTSLASPHEGVLSVELPGLPYHAVVLDGILS